MSRINAVIRVPAERRGRCSQSEQRKVVCDTMPNLFKRRKQGLFNVVVRSFPVGRNGDLPTVLGDEGLFRATGLRRAFAFALPDSLGGLFVGQPTGGSFGGELALGLGAGEL